MWKVDVVNSEGRIVKTHFFKRKSQAEKYENDSYLRNPFASNMNFKIEKVA